MVHEGTKTKNECSLTKKATAMRLDICMGILGMYQVKKKIEKKGTRDHVQIKHNSARLGEEKKSCFKT